MQYLKTIKTIDITYDSNEGEDLTIKGYFNSDQAGNHAKKKSTSGISLY